MQETGSRLQLRVCRPNHAARLVPLADERITIGRSPTTTIAIADPFLSRQHAEIVRAGSRWFLTDCGSVNGTYLNGSQIFEQTQLRLGDRITIGDNEIDVIEEQVEHRSEVTILPDDEVSRHHIVMPVAEASDEATNDADRLALLNRLAMELLEEKPIEELFDFIVEKVMDLLKPSRVALAILSGDATDFTDVRIRRKSERDSADLVISRTLLRDVVENRRVVSFTDDTTGALAMAHSIAAQSIRSALCAPIVVRDSVLGVLYIDYLLTQRMITESDVMLVAQIARVAARKLETTLLREEADSKRRLDEELQTAFLIQSRLLPAGPPTVDGYLFAGHNQPCRTVGGDYYDFVARPDGRVYVIVADVSGKGITAALVMAGVAASFFTLAQRDPGPGEILRDLNRMLDLKTDDAMFVTAFCALLDPRAGDIVYANAGHNPPWLVNDGDAAPLEVEPGIALGLLPDFEFAENRLTLQPGESLFLYTDGVTEATNGDEAMFEERRLGDVLRRAAGFDAEGIARASLRAVEEFVVGAPQADDITIVCVQRARAESFRGGELFDRVEAS